MIPRFIRDKKANAVQISLWKRVGDDARVRLCAARRYAVPKKKGFKGKDQQRNARELFQFDILLPYMRPSISIIYFEFSR